MKKTTILFLFLIAFVACGEKEVENEAKKENKSTKESGVSFTLEGVAKMVNAPFESTKKSLKTEVEETFVLTGGNSFPSFVFEAKDDKNISFSCYVTGNKTGSIETINVLSNPRLDKEKEFDVFLRYLEIADRSFKLHGDILDLSHSMNILSPPSPPDKTVKEFLEKVKKDKKKYVGRSITALFVDNTNREIKVEFTSTYVQIRCSNNKP